VNRIKQLRDEFGYTQQALATKIDGAKSTIAMYENETRKPSMEVLLKLSEIFSCSIDYLLGKSDIRNPEETIEKEFKSIYAKEIEGLTEEEIIDALRFYKQIKYGKNKK